MSTLRGQDIGCKPWGCNFQSRQVHDGDVAGTDSFLSTHAKDAMMTGIAYGWGYEEGLEEAERRKLEKKMNDDSRQKE